MKTSLHISLVLFAISAWCSSSAYAQLPDLRPDITDVSITLNQTVDQGDVNEGCAGSTTGRTLIRFSHTAWNDGPGDLLLGDPQCGDCSAHPGQTCANPRFICSGAGGHGHPHLQEFSSYKVYNEAGNAIVAQGHKEGFCLVNSTCTGSYPDTSGYPACSILSAGCADIYGSGLGCQYVDVTGLAPGSYRLDVTLNPLQTLLESSYDNNTQQVFFNICSQNRSPRGSIDVRFRNDASGAKSYKIESTGRISNLQGTFLPTRDALTLSISGGAGQGGAYSVTLPTNRRFEGCDPRDGWRRAKGGWEYRTFSGYTDVGCYSTANGLSRVTVKKSPRGGRNYIVKAEGVLLANYLTGKVSSVRFVASVPGAGGLPTNETCDSAALLDSCRYAGPDYNLHLLCKSSVKGKTPT